MQPWGRPLPRVFSDRGNQLYLQKERADAESPQSHPPSQLEAAETLSLRLEAIGNLHSDGRPILGLDSRNLLEITLDVCPEAILIPAHIWTPHFSMFGAFSGFDTIEECFEDLSPQIHAFETGLSSDPPMNWRLSALDRLTMISNSDAHSPQKLGREANLLQTECSYPAIRRAIQGKTQADFMERSNFSRRRENITTMGTGTARSALRRQKRSVPVGVAQFAAGS